MQNKILNKQDFDRMNIDIARILSGAIPQRIEHLLVSQWAEQKRMMPKGLTSRPGPFRWDNSPAMKEIADCLSDSSDVREVVIMKGAQVGGTVAVMENFIGYVIDASPGPMLAITGDKGMADMWMEKRVDPLIQSSGLQHKIFAQVQKSHGKKTGDTKDTKEFPGGFLMAIGPNSGSKLRSNAIQYLLLDEEDAYPSDLGDEGDPVANAIRRTDTYEDTRKILHISTPLTKGTSRVEAAFLDGDQRYYHIPCRKCNEKQPLEWQQMKWEKDSQGQLVWESVRYVCKHCGHEMRNSDKAWFLGRGVWVPSTKAKKRNLRSYHLSSLYASPGTRSWESIVEEWINCHDEIPKLRSFTNTVLGQTWEERGEAPRWEKVMLRLRGNYTANSLPVDNQALCVTLGADIQKDRIECEIVAWGESKRSWSIGYHVFYGETVNTNSNCWRDFARLIETPILGFNISMAMIDCGYNTSQVYQFCEKYSGGVYPIMSEPFNNNGKNIFNVRPVNGYALSRVNIQSGQLKSEIYSYIGRDMHEDDSIPVGYCQFPNDYSEEYFQQLTAESLHHVKLKSGATKFEWKKNRNRNEALDCRCYALAGLYVFAASIAGELSPDEPIAWDDFWKLLEGQGISA